MRPLARALTALTLLTALAPADAARLAASGLDHSLVVDALQVRVPGHSFDPLLDGEPVLPSDLRADGNGPRLRLVQFRGAVRGEWLAELEALGARPLQYYPHQTYLVWADAAPAAALDALPYVRWHGLFHPAYKIHSDLAGRQGRIERVEAVYYVDPGSRTADSLAALAGGLVADRQAQPDGAFRSAALEPDAAVLADLARLDAVLWLGYESPMPQLEDEMASQIVAGNHPGGVPVIGYFDHLASLGVDGAGVTWAVIDTGVDYDHPDLGPRIVGGHTFPGASCEPPAVPPGSDCPGGGHGTHVAGIVGGDATAGFADANNFLYGLGIAPEVSFFAMNIFAAAGDLPDYPRISLAGGAIGGNHSWTTGEGTAHGYQASERTTDFLVRDGDFTTPGVAEPFLSVWSAGNSGPGPMTLTAPKEAKNLISVANTWNFRFGDIDTIATLSSRGPALDGRWAPTVSAPGQVVSSTRNDTGGSCATAIPGTNNLYAFCSGTSMASPEVAGTLALVTQWWRGFQPGDPSPAMARALLVNHAVDMAIPPPIPNNDEGWGRVNVTNIIQPAVDTLYFDQETTFDGPGEQWTMEVAIDDPGRPLKITLAWSDAPGALGANPALVNDLDLVVETDGQTYLGNVFSGGMSTTGGSADVLNNLENVYVAAPGTTATVTVHATAVSGDGVPFSGDTTDQDFALVCNNCVDSTLFSDGFESGDTSRWSTTLP
jgi:subtilisin family serine protease